MKAIFLDRDGTLIKDYPDHDWAHISHLELLPDTLFALRKVPPLYALFIVTNQYLIHENIIAFEQFRLTHQHFLAVLRQANIRIQQTYFCPHVRHLPCKCRKPETGLIEQCLLNYDVDLDHSWVIGDSECDIQLAHAIGSASIAVGDYRSATKPDYVARDLTKAIDFIANG